EHVHDSPALECRELLHLAVERGGERACEREKPLHVVLRQISDRDEMPPPGAARRQQLVPDQGRYFGHHELLSGWGLTAGVRWAARAKDAGRARIELRYGPDRGRRIVPFSGLRRLRFPLRTEFN